MKNIFILFVLFVSYQGLAQDPHFSNYTNVPLQLNPAMTGQIQGQSSRLKIGSRDQWRSFLKGGGFHTTFVSFDRRFCPSNDKDYWGLGLQIMGDQRGNFPLQRMDVLISGAYLKRLSSNRNGLQYYLGVGGEIGFIHHRLGQKDWLFDEQFDNPNSAGEALDQFNFTMLDYGAGGMLYAANEQSTNFSFHAGLAMKHLGQPAYRFLDVPTNQVSSKLNRRFIGQLGVVLPIIENAHGLSIKSTIQHQRPYTQLLLNLDWIINFNKTSMMTLGAGLRQVRQIDGTLSDALIVSTSFSIQQMLLSLSYDANVSPLHKASGSFGALELTLGFVFGDGACDRVYCPTY